MISDSSAMARIAANFKLALATRQNARSSAKDLSLEVRPPLHCMRRCLEASSRPFMRKGYHVGFGTAEALVRAQLGDGRNVLGHTGQKLG